MQRPELDICNRALAANNSSIGITIQLHSRFRMLIFQLQVSWNNQQWSNVALFSFFKVPIELIKLYPVSGPITGATTVTLRGTNFTSTNEIICRFGWLQVVCKML